jgi:AcrR family transcriptional regulator
VVVEAGRILDSDTTAPLTLAAVADRLGVRIPSLYKHVAGLPALQRSLMVRAKRSLGDVMLEAAAGRAGADAFGAVAHAYRSWAREHPGQYPLTEVAGDAADAENLAASRRVLDLLLAILTSYDLDGDDALDAIRFVRATLHGFVSLETGGGFGLPLDIDRSFDRLVSATTAALSEWRAAGRGGDRAE